MNISMHARMRIHQRGLPADAIETILEFGRKECAPGGATKLIFGPKEYQKAIQLLKMQLQNLDKAKNTTFIMDNDNLITVYKCK